MHVNFAYDFLIGLLSTCESMWLHMYIAQVNFWRDCEGSLYRIWSIRNMTKVYDMNMLHELRLMTPLWVLLDMKGIMGWHWYMAQVSFESSHGIVPSYYEDYEWCMIYLD